MLARMQVSNKEPDILRQSPHASRALHRSAGIDKLGARAGKEGETPSNLGQ
jgi:hypothetical protein